MSPELVEGCGNLFADIPLVSLRGHQAEAISEYIKRLLRFARNVRLWKQIYRSNVKEYRLITTGTGLLDYAKEPYIVKRVIAERLEKGIRSRQLIPMSRDAKKIVEKDKEELRESRFLPEGTTLPATIIIFDGNVAFITTRKENTMILLASGDVAKTYETMFELVWNKAEVPN